MTRDEILERVNELDVYKLTQLVQLMNDSMTNDTLARLNFYEMGVFNEMFDGDTPLEVLDEVKQPFNTDEPFFLFNPSTGFAESVGEAEAEMAFDEYMDEFIDILADMNDDEIDALLRKVE